MLLGYLRNQFQVRLILEYDHLNIFKRAPFSHSVEIGFFYFSTKWNAQNGPDHTSFKTTFRESLKRVAPL
jgi:hypothetical protein